MKWYEYLRDFLAKQATSAWLKDAMRGAALGEAGIVADIISTGFDADADEIAKRSQIVQYMRAQIGKPYRLGAEVKPGAEWDAYDLDCSEATEAAFRIACLPLPDGAQNQFNATQPVKEGRPGDLHFLWSDKRAMIGHVMVDSGAGTVIHAVGGRGVVEDPLTMWSVIPRYRGVRRHQEFAREPHERA